MKDVIVIGIAGGTGSGKSTLVKKIKEEFNDRTTILSHDFYYKQHNDITFEQRKKLNYDHPDSFDTDLMIEHIRELASGREIQRPVYDFTIHNRVDDTVAVKPAKVIIVEGILIFENKELRDMFDIKLFIDTDADVRIIRRILRDVSERGRTLESVVNQYLTTVYARAVCGAVQEICGYNYTGGRTQSGGNRNGKSQNTFITKGINL